MYSGMMKFSRLIFATQIFFDRPNFAHTLSQFYRNLGKSIKQVVSLLRC